LTRVVFVRKARKSDIQSISGLTLEMHNYLAKLMGITFSVGELKHEEVDQSDLEKHNFYVAAIGEKVAGYVAFSKKILEDEWYGKYVHLYELAVAEAFRGMKIGQKARSNCSRLCQEKCAEYSSRDSYQEQTSSFFLQKVGFQAVKHGFHVGP